MITERFYGHQHKKYKIDGTYHLDTQFGNFKLKAKLVEREI